MRTQNLTLPTEFDIRHWVENLITPENADTEAKLLAKLLLTVASPDDDELYPLAVAAAKHAFTKTTDFRAAFEEFAGLPDTTRPGQVIDDRETNKSEVIDLETDQ
jgi:hypothetical protein